ncbi:MAG: hypothetical protein HY902_07930, partial [Deltaproteobacteria bacterium]|nr:hypothetical protein [Deltaproteobacteria bacterium]
WSVDQCKLPLPLAGPPMLGGPSLAAVAAVYCVEQFAGGLGASALIVFSLRTCNADFKAAHYAIATALASLGGAALGGHAGEIVASVGYTNLFLLSFAVAVPAMLILPFALRLPQLQDPVAAPQNS